MHRRSLIALLLCLPTTAFVAPADTTAADTSTRTLELEATVEADAETVPLILMTAGARQIAIPSSGL